MGIPIFLLNFASNNYYINFIETGSLLSIKKNTKGIVIPSEETRLTMYPMDYEEFRWALGDSATVHLLGEALRNRRSLGDAVTRKLMRDFRLYQKLLSDKLSANLGYVYENIVAQMPACMTMHL